MRIASCENGNGNVIAIQNVNLTPGARVVALMLGTTSAEGIMDAEDEVRMGLDVASPVAGSGGEDSGTDTNTGTSTSSNSNISTSSNISISINTNHKHHNNRMHHSSSSSKHRLSLRRRQLKLFKRCNHLLHHRSLRPMLVNILPRRLSNRTCRMGLTLIKHPFRFRILCLLMRA